LLPCQTAQPRTAFRLLMMLISLRLPARGLL
jgi:hypothetical protein